LCSAIFETLFNPLEFECVKGMNWVVSHGGPPKVCDALADELWEGWA
jgi:hypothetical protein